MGKKKCKCIGSFSTRFEGLGCLFVVRADTRRGKGGEDDDEREREVDDI